MNDRYTKDDILKYLEIFYPKDRSVIWLCEELNLEYSTAYTLCHELEKEGFVLIGARMAKNFTAALSEEGKHLLLAGGYKKKTRKKTNWSHVVAWSSFAIALFLGFLKLAEALKWWPYR